MLVTPSPVGPEQVVDLLGEGTNVVVPLGNGEPVTVLDAVEAAAGGLSGVRVHQMHALHDRPYHGDRLRHVSYFLSLVTRPHFASGATLEVALDRRARFDPWPEALFVDGTQSPDAGVRRAEAAL